MQRDKKYCEALREPRLTLKFTWGHFTAPPPFS
jgi:hypothetical protein